MKAYCVNKNEVETWGKIHKPPKVEMLIGNTQHQKMLDHWA